MPAPVRHLQGLARVRRGEWTCDGCGHVGEWGDGWKWLGVEEPRLIIQRVLCPSCPIDRPHPQL